MSRTLYVFTPSLLALLALGLVVAGATAAAIVMLLANPFVPSCPTDAGLAEQHRAVLVAAANSQENP
ncbi:hypothetical protein [Azohydromonas aeria]|uniref:hypothetical protein n=1 Tax=Azohydromonas aeria TaxID=2590212 RepID=UPI0012FBCCD1|nr:hypothetical protein [Azohydromonas aeria]